MMTDAEWLAGFKKDKVGEVHMIICAPEGYTAVDYCVAVPNGEGEHLVPLDVVVDPSSIKESIVRISQSGQVIFVAPKIAVMAFEAVPFDAGHMERRNEARDAPREFYS